MKILKSILRCLFRRPLMLACIIVLFCIHIYIHIKPFPENPGNDISGKNVYVTGQVADKLIKNEHYLVYLSSADIYDQLTGDKLMSDKQLILYLSEEDFPKEGSYIYASGQASAFREATNPGEFDLYKYYTSAGYHLPVYNCKVMQESSYYNPYKETLYDIRMLLTDTIYSCFYMEDSPIIAAMLLGDKGGLDPDIKSLYQKSGISHILAISGLHISILGAIIFWLLNKLPLPRIICLLIPIAFIISYGIMTGLSTSTFRAVFMFCLMLGGKLFLRTYDLLTALSLAALVLTIQNPYILYGSSFFLSFFAVMGIAIYSQIFMPKTSDVGRLKYKILSAFLSTTFVSIFTFPLIAYYYYEYPVYSILLNMLVIPLMSVLMVLALLGVMSGLISISLSHIFIYPCHLILKLYEKLSIISSDLPFSHVITGKPSIIKVILFFILQLFLILTSYYLKHHEQDEKPLSPRYHALALRLSRRCRILIALLSLLIFINIKNGLQITILDVGQGDGSFMSSGELNIMIDGGSSNKNNLNQYTIEPFLKYSGIYQIDYWIISHPDLDHTSALIELLENYNPGDILVDNIILPDSSSIYADASDIIFLADSNDINVLFLKTGDKIISGDLSLYVVWPEDNYSCQDANEYSLVLLMDYQGVQGLFTGDATLESENGYINNLHAYQKSSDKIDFLKVGHHGSNTSTGDALLEYLSPRYAFISSGLNNRYGHPHAEVLERLNKNNACILNTQNTGAIIIKIVNGSLMVSTYR